MTGKNTVSIPRKSCFLLRIYLLIKFAQVDLSNVYATGYIARRYACPTTKCKRPRHQQGRRCRLHCFQQLLIQWPCLARQMRVQSLQPRTVSQPANQHSSPCCARSTRSDGTTEYKSKLQHRTIHSQTILRNNCAGGADRKQWQAGNRQA